MCSSLVRGKNSTSALFISKVDLNCLYLQFITNHLVIMCYDMSEFIFLHNIFKLKSYFFKIRMALKTLITKSLSIQGNKKFTCAVTQKESDLSY